MFTGCLFAALALLMFRESTLLTGGTTGLAFLIHYLGGWPLGAILFVLNLPFYVFGLRTLGRVFTIKTFCAVAVLSLQTELL
ncbi:MAG: YitT family protein, partial [Thauera sp.]|nr:YitT family protein [Thauera sp.]